MADDKRAMSRLRKASEEAKVALSSADETSVCIDALSNGLDLYTTVTRSTFEELNEYINNGVKSTLITVESALGDAKMKKERIDDIVLVGGSARIPKVQEMLQTLFNSKKLCQSSHPDEAVAYGAAIQASILYGDKSQQTPDMVPVDVTPLSIGIEVKGVLMDVAIPRNTAIPAKATRPYATTRHYQKYLPIKVFEGERASTTHNRLLGEFKLEGITIVESGVPKITVTFDLDANGILNIKATEAATDTSKQITITNEANRLRQEQIARMIADAATHEADDKLYKAFISAKNALQAKCTSLKRFAIDDVSVSAARTVAF